MGERIMYTTRYDELRDQIRERLTEVLAESLPLLDESIWGYDEMRPNYAIDTYKLIKDARDAI